MKYTAQASSAGINGEVKLSLEANSLIVSALFDTEEIPFVSINELILENYAVTVKTDNGEYFFSRMGSWVQPFYDVFKDMYNKAVLRAFFVSDNLIIKAAGCYEYSEEGFSASGKAAFQVYENCAVILPPDSNARRIPLCFTVGMDSGDFRLNLRLNNGDSYTFAKLGHETEVFIQRIETQIRALREKALAALKEFDLSLTPIQASKLAKLLPEGAAAPIGKIAEIAPNFITAFEKRILGTRIGESYKAFKELCEPSKIWVGFKKNYLSDDSDDTSCDIPPFSFWMIAPSSDGEYAVVEFSQTDTATFIYRTDGDFDGCAMRLNRALEAISFRREVIRLTDEELLKSENADYCMASKRTASLKYVRANFAGRIIHNSSWKHKLEEILEMNS